LSMNRGAAIRLLGVGATDLSLTPQLDMFAAQESVRDDKLDSALDEIRAKFGAQSVGRASSLRPRR
jgi:hypothetical protein